MVIVGDMAIVVEMVTVTEEAATEIGEAMSETDLPLVVMMIGEGTMIEREARLEGMIDTRGTTRPGTGR